MRIALSLAALLTLSYSTMAAPLPKDAKLSDQYLPDDTFGIAVVNVKQIVASPLFKKDAEKQITDLLKLEPVASLLKEAGLDPLRDVERVYLIFARSSYNEKTHGGEPIVLVQGRFDAAKLQAGVEKAVRDLKGYALKTHARGDAKLFEVIHNNGSLFGAMLDKESVLLSIHRAHIENALDKAAGKKKTDLKYKAFVNLYGKINPERSLTILVAGDMVSYTMIKPEAKLVTFADQGFVSIEWIAEVGDTGKIRATMVFNAEDKAKQMEKETQRNFAREIESFEMFKMPAMARVFKDMKITTKDKVLTIEVPFDAEAAREFVKFNSVLFGGGSKLPAKPGETDPKKDTIKNRQGE